MDRDAVLHPLNKIGRGNRADAPDPGNWESYLGIKGAAWVGGIAFLLSAVFFARWAIDRGLIGPGTGFVVMLAVGLAALASAEFGRPAGESGNV